ncbi:MAG: peptidoglycan-binding protein, partial [Oscillospiraceae bacterium]|nr:peptidoglycan-binding protein [Oscillospiraceae bacterium]
KYGNGAERKAKLEAAGYDYETVQRLVNGLSAGYGKVAQDVIDGKYGNGGARVAALKAAGFDAQLVQDIVNGILL